MIRLLPLVAALALMPEVRPDPFVPSKFGLGVPNATWCSELAWEASTDSYKCADENGNIIPTRREELDMPFCPYLVRDDRPPSTFRCAHKNERGPLTVWEWDYQ